jgi:filamentous hemagglutinin
VVLPGGGVVIIPIWIVTPVVTDKFPDTWPVEPNKKKIGYRWQDPANPKGNGVRIDKGDPNSPFPSQQVDHVIVRSNGKVLGRDGKPIGGDGSIQGDPENAHIPLSEYKDWSKWNEK